MADFKETTAAGKSWIRSNGLTVSNIHKTIPILEFGVESAINIEGGETVLSPKDPIKLRFNPSDSFAIIDPATGEPTGATATHMQIYILLHSLFISEATRVSLEEEAAAEALIAYNAAWDAMVLAERTAALEVLNV